MKKPSATVIIQARMGSTRLSGKALLDLCGKPVLHHVIERSKAIRGIERVVLATCFGDENRPLIGLAESLCIGVFVGSENNVLERYYQAAEQYGGEYIIRVTGDNPLTDPEYGSLALAAAVENNADLCSIKNLPLGTGVGVIKKTALAQAYKYSDRPHQLEHVSPYIKENSSLFKIVEKEANLENPFPDLRLTVDTPEDYALVKIIYEELFTGEIFSLERVIGFLREKPDLIKINSTIEQRPMTHSSFGQS